MKENVTCKICKKKYHLCSACDVHLEFPFLYAHYCSYECAEKDGWEESKDN